MSSPSRLSALAFAVCALLCSAVTSAAASFSSVIVYGDSLSDNGNLYNATAPILGTGYPPPPYYNGRFSNGPVAVEQLAAQLTAPLIDHAFGGATTGIGNQTDLGTVTSLGLFGLPGMLSQLAAFGSGPADPNALYVVWGGANDYELGGSAAVAAHNIDTIVAALEGAGAQHILVPGLPDLGLTPEFLGNAGATQFTNQFNTALQAGLSGNAIYFDTFGVLNSIVANPSAYGFTNTNTACLTATGLCSNPNQYLFWDDIHPTTAADAILARDFAAAVTVAPTPEPSSVLLLGSGLAGLAGVLRRRRRAA